MTPKLESAPELSIIIPSMNEALNLEQLLPVLGETLASMGVASEILVVDPDSPDGTRAVVEKAAAGPAPTARYVCETEHGYGTAILRGVAEARGTYLLTMDADLSHPARFIEFLWAARDQAEIVIASRYVAGGRADQPLGRLLLSQMLNGFFRFGLSLDVRDMSSGFRLYHRDVFREIEPRFTNFVILVEILLRAFQRGKRIAEVPFHYQPRGAGRSHAQIVQFGLDYLRLFHRMWRLRNSIHFPDYDWRAYDSRIPLQRYWQRRRCDIVTRFVPAGVSTVDVGCGSSRILAMLDHVVGVDLRLDKLRFMRRTARPLVQADGCALPFAAHAFECVICSEVIEHIPNEGGRLLDELDRILAPGGTLVLGTPDYGGWQWRVIEWFYDRIAPGAYGDEHVTQYTYQGLHDTLVQRGYAILDHAYILHGELIFQARKASPLD